MKKVLLLFTISAIASSCVDYDKRADKFIADNDLDSNVVLRHTDKKPHMLIYVDSAGVSSCNLSDMSVTLVVDQPGISSWESGQNPDMLLTQSYGGKVRITNFDFPDNKELSINTVFSGTFVMLYGGSRYILLSDGGRYCGFENGSFSEVKTVDEYLDDNNIDRKCIIRYYNNSDNAFVFYKPAGNETGPMYYYNGHTGESKTYDDCMTAYGNTTDEYALLYKKKIDNGCALVLASTYTGAEAILASGSAVDEYLGCYRVTNFDSTFSYFNAEGMSCEEPKRTSSSNDDYNFGDFLYDLMYGNF